jgi:hypothetical protein
MAEIKGVEEKLPPPEVVNPDTVSPVPNMRRCPTCGQEYNANHVLEYFHHNEPGPHDPIA